MNAVDVRELIKVCRIRNLDLPISIEVTARAFHELKHDLCAVPYSQADGKLKPNELFVCGIKIIGKLCECGAHPEDWQ